VRVKPLRRLPLGSLRVFVSVAQHLSFTRAADALGVTASAASLQIRALEEYLGRRLFRRNGRQVILTNEGSTLLPRIQHALAEMELAVDDVRLDRSAGPLRVTTLPSFLQLWLLPRIARFRTDHPEIDLHIHTSTDMVDFVRDDFQGIGRVASAGMLPGPLHKTRARENRRRPQALSFDAQCQ
jgi:LysR family glycine cleavage system transcriptional activator